MIRPSVLETLMAQAEITSFRSHDAETKVGSLIVSKDRNCIESTGFNGFISGANDEDLPNTRPEKYKYIIHSEINALANMAYSGKSTKGCYVVCTHTPCSYCMRALYQAGITKVIAKYKYRDFDDIKSMRDMEITESVTSEGFFELNYQAKKREHLVKVNPETQVLFQDPLILLRKQIMRTVKRLIGQAVIAKKKR